MKPFGVFGRLLRGKGRKLPAQGQCDSQVLALFADRDLELSILMTGYDRFREITVVAVAAGSAATVGAAGGRGGELKSITS